MVAGSRLLAAADDSVTVWAATADLAAGAEVTGRRPRGAAGAVRRRRRPRPLLRRRPAAARRARLVARRGPGRAAATRGARHGRRRPASCSCRSRSTWCPTASGPARSSSVYVRDAVRCPECAGRRAGVGHGVDAPAADELTGARQLVLAVEQGDADRWFDAAGHARDARSSRSWGADVVVVLVLAAGARLGVSVPSPGSPTGATWSCSSAASTSATCSPPRPRARPTWPGRRSTRPASTATPSTTCAATASGRWRCCPAGPDLDAGRPAGHPDRGPGRRRRRRARRARRCRRRRRRARAAPWRASPRRRAPSPSAAGAGRGGVGSGRRPGAYDARGRPGRRARPHSPHDPGRRRPLRRRGRPAARHRRRGLGAAGRDPRWPRPASSPERFGSVQRSLDHRLSVVTGLPRADRWVEVRAGVVEHLLEVAARARRTSSSTPASASSTTRRPTPARGRAQHA